MIEKREPKLFSLTIRSTMKFSSCFHNTKGVSHLSMLLHRVSVLWKRRN